jgi:LmbE family N-acetylglucosaminyl deacetylase
VFGGRTIGRDRRAGLAEVIATGAFNVRLDFANERVLAVLAHPDDEFLCAGTLARAKTDGAAVGLSVLCRGDKGQPDPPVADLAAVRRREMAAAAALLGAELFHGEFGDGELVDSVDARLVLVEIYRRFRPTLVLAHSASDYHADHRAASALGEAASWFSTSPGHRTGAPPLDAPPALWWLDTVGMHGFAPHFSIDVSEHVDLKRRVICCHQSQLTRASLTGTQSLEDLMVHHAEARGAQFGVKAAESFRVHRAWKRVRAW